MPGSGKRIRRMIENSFGKNPLEGFNYYNGRSRMEKIRRLHEKNGAGAVDDITWNDLEMDEIFLRLNHTNSFIGEQTLYHRLHMSESVIDAPGFVAMQETHISFLKGNRKTRLEIEEQLSRIGKYDEGYYLYEFLINADLWKVGSPVVYHLLQLIFFCSLMSVFIFDNAVALAVLLISVTVNLAVYMYSKNKYEVYLSSLSEFKKIYDFSKWVNGKAELKKQFVSEDTDKSIKNLNGMSRIIIGMNGRRQNAMTGDLFAMLLEYMYGIMLFDVSMFNHIMKVILYKQEEVLNVLKFAGQMDMDISILSFRESVEQWCEPVYGDKLVVRGLVHPMIKNPVSNDFELEDRAIITGANAAGKSTFMKTMAINCILAQSINTCTAEHMILKPVLVCTCMALRDDVMTGESYYFREAKYLKRMLDVVSENGNENENESAHMGVLIVIDEILKGTNTKERIAASKAILDYIGKAKCYALVATHDNELTQNEKYKDYYFSSSINENDIVFDYKIHEGVCGQTNAIALLSYLDYPEEIIRNAKENICV